MKNPSCLSKIRTEFLTTTGMSALLTMRNWMFIKQFSALREWILETYDLRSLGDFAVGAFDEVPNDVLSIVISVIRKVPPVDTKSVATQPTPLNDKSYDRQRTNRKRAAVLAQVGRIEFDPSGFEVIEGEPIVYWWADSLISRYKSLNKVRYVCPAKFGVTTGDNTRYLRKHWEVFTTHLYISRAGDDYPDDIRWCAFVMGAAGRVWFEPYTDICEWKRDALQLRVFCKGSPGANIRNPDCHFTIGVAFSMIGSAFSARAHRYRSVIGNKGSSVFSDSIADTVCTMNCSESRHVLESLNPGIGFEVGDVNRLPIFPIASADEIYATIDRAFTEHEAARETSVEFKRPGPSPWRYAQDWAQRSVDRPEGEPLPPYEPEYDPPAPVQHLSYAFGTALGRFGPDGEGILDATRPEHQALIEQALPHGILFLTAVNEERSSLAHPACELLRRMWHEHGSAIRAKTELDEYLRRWFFAYHKGLYENRPIFLPLSSSERSFVAWISIHRWSSDTLQTLLAEHLYPERQHIEGELEDMRSASLNSTPSAAVELRHDQLKRAQPEIQTMIEMVSQLAEHGPPPTGPKCPPRAADARFEMDLDDGVMVNSAALWPLLEPQWKTGACPKKWWQELATAKGKKDYDWSHLAARYFPDRVKDKCQQDPSLAVAHGCFWQKHPAKAYQWELRLQDEIEPEFHIDEEGSDQARAQFLAEHKAEAKKIRAKEMKRRRRKQEQAGVVSDQPKTLYDGQEIAADKAEAPSGEEKK